MAAASASHSLRETHPASGAANTAGKGELTAAGTWDEFPNGRFGDSKSPAFGVTDLWDKGMGVPVSLPLRPEEFLLIASISPIKRSSFGAIPLKLTILPLYFYIIYKAN